MSLLRYIELKSGHADRGPAWIGRVALSRSKTTVYFNGRALKKSRGQGIAGNYTDLETGDEYWVSGVKRNGADRHWAGGGRILVEDSTVAEYLAFRKLKTLDRARHEITDAILQTDIAKFTAAENPQEAAGEVSEEDLKLVNDWLARTKAGA